MQQQQRSQDFEDDLYLSLDQLFHDYAERGMSIEDLLTITSEVAEELYQLNSTNSEDDYEPEPLNSCC